MAMYISIDVDGHRHLMGRKTQITLTDRQHAFRPQDPPAGT